MTKHGQLTHISEWRRHEKYLRVTKRGNVKWDDEVTCEDISFFLGEVLLSVRGVPEWYLVWEWHGKFRPFSYDWRGVESPRTPAVEVHPGAI